MELCRNDWHIPELVVCISGSKREGKDASCAGRGCGAVNRIVLLYVDWADGLRANRYVHATASGV